MIIHHIHKANLNSSFKRLVNYLLNPQGKEERVGAVKVSHCQNQEINWSVVEIEAVQAKNTRAKGDKTYHVVISFAPGEEPPSKTLKIIEQRVIDSIGLSDHQRISVVHHDTDNLHIHLAINKIHPKTYKMVEPYHAYKKFAEVATKLEKEFNLVQTNHIPKHQRSENLAQNMEHHSGIESLISWMKSNCLSQLKVAKSWQEFNQVLSDNGLTIKRKANGFVFCTDKGLMVKASSISRELSKPKLEKQLGVFCDTDQIKNQSKYKKQPTNKGKKSMDLYEQYEAEKRNQSNVVAEKLKALSNHKKRLYDKAQKKSKRKRQATGLMSGSRASKQIIHTLISRQYEKDAEKIKRQCQREREQILNSAKNLSWADWLKQKAQEGNIEALEVLRQKERKNHAKYGFEGNTPQKTTIDTERLDSVTKNGTAIYKMGECTVKDDGKKLNISRGISQDDLKKVILMAKKQYGSCINVNGNEVFKKTVVRVAVRNNLDITFSNKKLEKMRQKLTKEKEQLNEHTRRNDGNGQRAGCGDATSERRSRDRGGFFKRLFGRGTCKPHPNRFRGSKAPENTDSLRNLSKLNVVEFPRRSEVLLSDNAHDKLQRDGSKPDHKMRRGIFGWKLGRKNKTQKKD